ncbi:MAG: DUF58 domain-containing protein [Robiginitomaculum sp.]|nr:DUF58 domain-containing protein [Robiginitomaculum sp.]
MPIKNQHTSNQQANELAAKYPALLSEARRISANVVHGSHGRRKRGSGETFWEFRRARDEDPASAIDWRRSGRSDALFVRETEWEAANTVFLWRDNSPQMNWRSNDKLPLKCDRAAVLLTALSIVLLRGAERCMVPGVSQKPGTGIGAIERISREIITGTSLANSIILENSRNHAHLVIASDFLEGAQIWTQRLKRISQNGISVILLHISDPAEENFPFTGHVLFADSGNAEKIDMGRAQAAKTIYQQRFKAGREQIKAIASKNNWHFLNHRTDQHPANVFLALYQYLGVK